MTEIGDRVRFENRDCICTYAEVADYWLEGKDGKMHHQNFRVVRLEPIEHVERDHGRR